MAETFISPREAMPVRDAITPMGKPPRPQTAYRPSETMSRASGRPMSVAKSSVAFGSGATGRSSKYKSKLIVCLGQEMNSRAQSAAPDNRS